MQEGELARHVARLAHASQELPALAGEGPQDLLLAVRVVDEGLVAVRREGHVPGRADAGRIVDADPLLDPDVPLELAQLVEHLDAVTLAVVYVHQAVAAEV